MLIFSSLLSDCFNSCTEANLPDILDKKLFFREFKFLESFEKWLFILGDIILNKLPEIFAPEEVDRIYLNFSDPWPKDRHARRRLTSHEFLDRYDQFLAADGRLEFKTDNQDLFTFSLEEIETSDRWHLNASTRDLHHDPSMNEGNIMTEYEEKFSSKGNPICKLIASR